MLETFWLRVWSHSYDVEVETAPDAGVNYYLTVYAIISIGEVIIETFRAFEKAHNNIG